MVYTAAVLLGPGSPVMSEEESVIDMIGRYLSRLTSPAGEKTSVRRGSVESCDETDNNSLFSSMDAGAEGAERLLQQDVSRRIERCLVEAKASPLQCRVLLLPRQMTARISRDVLRSSADEPCGLRGACIKVYVESKGGLKALGNICPDPSVTPTFELSVVLKAESDDGWPPLKHIFDGGKALKLRPEYRLVKRKLYSSACPVVHEFN